MKIELTEEQADLILVALIEKFNHDVESLVDNPESDYYLSEVVKTKRTRDIITKTMLGVIEK